MNFGVPNNGGSPESRPAKAPSAKPSKSPESGSGSEAAPIVRGTSRRPSSHEPLVKLTPVDGDKGDQQAPPKKEEAKASDNTSNSSDRSGDKAGFGEKARTAAALATSLANQAKEAVRRTVRPDTARETQRPDEEWHPTEFSSKAAWDAHVRDQHNEMALTTKEQSSEGHREPTVQPSHRPRGDSGKFTNSSHY